MSASQEKCDKINMVEQNNVPKIFQPDWFDIWMSLMALRQFGMGMYDSIGLKLVKIRALPTSANLIYSKQQVLILCQRPSDIKSHSSCILFQHQSNV